MTIGTGGTIVTLISFLERFGTVSNIAKRLLIKQELSPMKLLSLARVSAKSLGFTDPPTHEELVRRTAESGLVLCPVDTSVYLRNEHLHQPKDEPIIVASEPLLDEEGVPHLLTLTANLSGEPDKNLKRHLELTATPLPPGHRWPLNQKLVFAIADPEVWEGNSCSKPHMRKRMRGLFF